MTTNFLLLAVPSQQAARAALSQAADDHLIAAHLMQRIAWVGDASQMAACPAHSTIYCAPHAYRTLDRSWQALVAEMNIDLVELNSGSFRQLVQQLLH